MAAGKEKTRWIAALLFLVYLAILFYLLFWSPQMGRTDEAEYRYNLAPFHEILRYIRYSDHFDWKVIVVNLAGNILAFVPFGYFICRLSPHRVGMVKTTFYTFAFSLLVELTQLALKRGSFDVDDLILNTVGGFLGFWLFWYIHKKK